MEATAGLHACSEILASPNSSAIHWATRASVISSNRSSWAAPCATSSHRDAGSPEIVSNAIRYNASIPTSMTVLGIDIGATKIAAGRVNERAEVTQPRTTPTRSAEGFDVSIAQGWQAI